MQRVSGGYTILEVMIFLAVSTILLAAAANLISGHQSQVQFDVGMRDIQTKLQDWINDVATGFSGGDPTQLKCTVGNGPTDRPVISTNGPSATPDCIFIGKVIQFTDKSSNQDQKSTLYAYSIFGRRADPSTGQLTSDILDSNPIAATGQGGSGNADLTESHYVAPAMVKSVCVKPVGSNSCASNLLIGFFSSFNTEQNTAQNGSENINAYEYNFDDNQSSVPGDQPSGGDIRGCLELSSDACKKPNGVSQWPAKLSSAQICFTDNRRTALITISSTGGLGASVSLDYQSC